MSESLLSFSEVLLFGREITDLKLNQRTVRVVIVVPAGGVVPAGIVEIDGVALNEDDRVLVQAGNQANNLSGIYKTQLNAANTFDLVKRKKVSFGSLVYVRRGRQFKNTFWLQDANRHAEQLYVEQENRRRGNGVNNLIGDQFGGNAKLARIYSFGYEGTVYDLPEPSIFLVHGNGVSATDRNRPPNNGSRAPSNPDISGVSSADYQVADDIQVWSYDKADFTIRMDVMTGQFEQVLLDIYFGFDSPAISGARVSGARVSGARVSGARVSGARVSGARVSGARARGSED
jgi:hypothetical protein